MEISLKGDGYACKGVINVFVSLVSSVHRQRKTIDSFQLEKGWHFILKSYLPCKCIHAPEKYSDSMICNASVFITVMLVRKIEVGQKKIYR